MNATCPDLEQLDQYAVDPSRTSASIRGHVADCGDCQARLIELAENQALFVELSGSAAVVSVQLAAPAPPPARVGGFEIVREVGRGGMGVVYEAWQGHPERRVALKVLRRDYAASDERIRFFNREIRALARLRHPGITSIFESGVDDGGPFYAMEFVDGVPLTEYANRERLDLRPRLHLFLKLCAAISYAHQHGVIHRDLKPGNVLVEEGGALKVLDFGLARITDSDVTCASLVMDTGRIVGTLAYMSPEQTRGVPEEIDLRSDVYSLGVVLFELLVGSLPYDMPRTSVPTAIRQICEVPPRRPSLAAVGHVSHARYLRGDLDTILLKALEKSPEKRYQSGAALAEDLERYLGNQTIIARPPSALYQIRKFAQRNRLLVGNILVVFVALGLGLVTTTWQARRARDAERHARAEASTHAEISRFLTTMFSSVNPVADGHDVRVVEILKRAAAEIEGSFVDQPRVAVGLRDAIGRAYQSLTLYPEAEPQFQAGLVLARRQYGDESREALQFQYNLAEAMAHNGRVQQALESLNATLEAQARRVGTDDPDTLMTRQFLAVLKVENGELDTGEALLRETLAGGMRALGPEHERTLAAMANLGALMQRRGRRDEAGIWLRRVHETTKRMFGPDSPRTLVAAADVATLAKTPAEYEAVEPIYRDIVERSTRVFGPDHQQTLAFQGSFVQLLTLRCKTVEAEAVARDLYEQLNRSRGERDARTLSVMAQLGRLLRRNRKWAEAEKVTGRLLELRRDIDGESAPAVTDVMFDMISVLDSSSQLDRALPLARETLARYAGAGGDHAVNTALTRALMAEVLRKQGRLDESKAAVEAALNDLRAGLGPDDIQTAWTECRFGTCLRDQKRFAEAEPLMRHAHDRLVAGLGRCNDICVEATQRTVELYRAWLAADPAGGHDKQLSEFEASLGDNGASASRPAAGSDK